VKEGTVADYRLMFPNDYLGAHEFMGKDVTKTIRSIGMEDLRVQGGKKERRPVITFADAKKKLVLNKTNAKTIASIYGTDTATWTGKRITMYPTTCMLGKERVDCIRIREKAGAAPGRVPVDEHPLDIDDGQPVHGIDATPFDGETGEVFDGMDPDPSAGQEG
jgi:hypothetical protein